MTWLAFTLTMVVAFLSGSWGTFMATTRKNTSSVANAHQRITTLGELTAPAVALAAGGGTIPGSLAVTGNLTAGGIVSATGDVETGASFVWEGNVIDMGFLHGLSEMSAASSAAAIETQLQDHGFMS